MRSPGLGIVSHSFLVAFEQVTASEAFGMWAVWKVAFKAFLMLLQVGPVAAD